MNLANQILVEKLFKIYSKIGNIFSVSYDAVTLSKNRKVDGMKYVLYLLVAFMLFSCSESTEPEPNILCETVINAHGPGYLKVINRYSSKVYVFLPEYALLIEVSCERDQQNHQPAKGRPCWIFQLPFFGIMAKEVCNEYYRNSG